MATIMRFYFNIRARLLLAFTATIFLVVVAMAWAVNWAFQRGFVEYLQQVELNNLNELTKTLVHAYTKHGNWDFIRHNPPAWKIVFKQALGANMRHHHPPHWNNKHPPPPRPWIKFFHLFGHPPPPPPPHDPTDLLLRLRVLNAEHHAIFGQPQPNYNEILHPILHNGITIGFLAVVNNAAFDNRLAFNFQLAQRRAYVLIAIIAIILSTIAASVLSQRLVRPLQLIAAGTSELSVGRYNTRIKIESQDELGRLAEDFNRLAAALEQNEQTRRQWIADISHELRTPLAILRGEIEAIQDGIRIPSPERLHSLHGEVIGLGKLVNDLYELALSDIGALTYQWEHLDIKEILTDTITNLHAQFIEQQLTLVNNVQESMPLLGDFRRLQQLFTNLLENSRRYTDSYGRVEIYAYSKDNWYKIVFQDSVPGVSNSDLERIFERLYRVDKSRSRTLGGAGLGLAICRNIVEAHGGKIKAAHSVLGGLEISIKLPFTTGKI